MTEQKMKYNGKYVKGGEHAILDGEVDFEYVLEPTGSNKVSLQVMKIKKTRSMMQKEEDVTGKASKAQKVE